MLSFPSLPGQVEEGYSDHDQRRTWRNQPIELQLPDSLSADKMEERNPDQQSSYGKFFSPYWPVVNSKNYNSRDTKSVDNGYKEKCVKERRDYGI